MEVRFVIVAPPKARNSYRVRLPVVAGRGDEAKFRIQHDSVSRLHCDFSVDDGVVCVTDLGSTNGTFVGDTKIDARVATAVPSGAQVRIGGIVLRVEYAASPGEPPGTESPELEPSADALPELRSEEELAPAADARGAEQAEAADEPGAAGPAFPEGDMPPPPADGSFDFLGGDTAAPAAAEDDNLDDFFKSIS